MNTFSKIKLTKHSFAKFIFFSFIFFNTCGTTEPVSTDWTKGFSLIKPDDSFLTDSLKTIFKTDAAILALRDVQINPSTKETLIDIPEELIELYYSALVHVYKYVFTSQDTKLRNVLAIHVFRTPETRSVILAIDSSKQWAKEWRRGNTKTGYSKIDELIESYKLKLSSINPFIKNYLAVVYSEKPLNALALSKRFQGLDGIIYSEPNGIAGDGNDIKTQLTSARMILNYSLGWGDCPSGCISRHYWKFEIDKQGVVRLLEEGGDSL